MLVGDLIYNDDMDFNCNYRVYDCRECESWQKAPLLFDTKRDGFKKPMDWILDLRAKCMVIHNNCAIIETDRME